jgi:hypothetical protein
LRFIAYLARRLDGLPVTVIGSVRTGEGASDELLVGELERSPGTQLASLASLTEDGVGTMLAADFGRAPAEGFARTCRGVTGGNPFLVRELAAALIADGIEPTADAIERISSVAPETIARVTLARLGRLSGDAAELARAVAVLGGDATVPRAASLAGLGERAVLLALDALVAADVLSVGGGFEFRHSIVRAAIYDALAPGERSMMHRRVAVSLAAEGAELDAVAGHLLASEPVGSPDTIATLRDAAVHALGLGAPEIAASYLSRALAEGPERELRTTVLLELGRAERLARHPTAIERFEDVRRLAEDPTTRARAMIEQAEILSYVGEWRQALGLLDGAIEELTEREGAVALRAEAIRATLMAYDPRLVDAFEQRVPRLHKLAASRRPGSRPLAMLLAGWGMQRGEPPERTFALVQLGWDEGRYLVDADTIELLPQGVGSLLAWDQLDRASEMVDRLRAVANTSGSVMQYVLASVLAAWIDARRGNLVAAAAEMRDSLEHALEHGLQLAVLATLAYCVDVLLERPDAADLAALAETIEPGPFTEVAIGATAAEARGRLRFAAGQRTAAIADLRHAAAV